MICNCCNQIVEFVTAGQVMANLERINKLKRKAIKDINPSPKKLFIIDSVVGKIAIFK